MNVKKRRNTKTHLLAHTELGGKVWIRNDIETHTNKNGMINLYKLVKQFLGGWHNKKGATYEATDQPSETGVVLCCVLCLVELQLNNKQQRQQVSLKFNRN